MTEPRFKILKPLVNPRPFKWGVYDIETLGKDSLEFYSVGFFDGREYCYFRDMGSFLDHCLAPKYHGYRFFAHFGGRFDVHFVFDYLRKHEPSTDIYFVCSGSCVIALTVRSGKHYWKFCDSYRLLPRSLKTLTTDFDVEHKKLEFDSKSMEYNRHDCLGLHEVLTEFFNLFGLTSETLASHSMRVFRNRFQQYPLWGVHSKIEDFVRAGYFGGRCEIFRYDLAQLRHYDFNSMYPAAMLEPVPVEYLGESCALPDDDSQIGFYFAQVKYPEVYTPALPVLTEGKLFFPVGPFDGFFTSIELREAITDGAAVSIVKGILFETDNLLEDYAREIYKLKVKAERDGRAGVRYVAKIMLNSLYGKTGQKRVQRSYLIDTGEEGLYPLPDGLAWKFTYSNATHILPHIASTITSRARAMLLKYLRECRSWYTDTDSIFTKSTLPVSDGIGSMKLEGEGRFQAYRLKEYRFGADIKTKGVPHGDDALLEKYLAGEPVRYRRMAGFLESIRDGRVTTRFVDVTKVRREVFDKRKREGADTRPWTIREIRACHNRGRLI